MTLNSKDVSWRWVATGAIVIAGFFIAGWIGRVDAFGGAISELQKNSIRQAVTLKHMAKQVDEIHLFIFDGGNAKTRSESK